MTEPVSSRAFVIDDEAGICSFIAMALDSLGVQAETFGSADPAISALEQGHPAFVFLDIALGGSDAVDVIRALADMRYRGNVQLMSGSDVVLLDDVRRIGVRHGLNMRSPLKKPMRLDDIRQAITVAPMGGQAKSRQSSVSAVRVELAEALDRGWLELWYQPKIDLRSNTISGIEGLIRCRHPEHGVLTPASFLPGADDQSMTHSHSSLSLRHCVTGANWSTQACRYGWLSTPASALSRA